MEAKGRFPQSLSPIALVVSYTQIDILSLKSKDMFKIALCIKRIYFLKMLAAIGLKYSL